MTRDGRQSHPLHELWRAMVRRCHDPKATGYENYGGRGISVCDRWRQFWNFVADVGPRPSAEYSLDRYPDNNGNYEPGNVRWATWSEQSRNTRYNRLLTAFGKTQTLQEWSIETGLAKSTIFNRLRRGWDEARAVTRKPNKKLPDNTLMPQNGIKTCVELGIPRETVASRIRRGWTWKDAISRPIDHRRNRHADRQRS